MNHKLKTMRRLRAHVSQAVRGFPGMSRCELPVHIYTCIHKTKQVFGLNNFVSVFGFLRSKTSGKYPGKGVCTQLISISLSLFFFLDVFFASPHSPLHLACISGFVDVVAALIRMAPHPCLLNIQNDVAQTPLHLAALTVQPTILRMLLLAGAEVS